MAYLNKQLAITKKTWNGLVVLFAIIIVVYFSRIYTFNVTADIIDDKALKDLVKKLNRANAEANYPVAAIKKFNPDTLSLSGWKKLGLTERQATVIMHYRQKGGRFYTKTDVARLYSISARKYKQLEPFIDLPEGKSGHTHKAKLIVPLELNSADTAKLKTVYGIGPAFAKHIIKYRELLGGFHSKRQLLEVYGMDREKYQEIGDQLKVNPAYIKKIDVNQAEAEELNRLPYLNYKQANAIVQYRLQHGEYLSADDLADIAILDAATINKIKPYLVFK
ncbi:helix-hairpin-helix domain-containing protein [Mucilaginibacter roseus]|uniref:Helix-hairpin-helix domain-containing protein n=1 Tax=Mucilaginibacter roseus TaxID=1528868 RepID=A0ABS8U0D5_9SPHI|nr:helix-hairpin-helix domain-containing protein [Mucilaginibacter roseus]MCD8740569.1 helix-hairpin-helix domain-containing protein [Mucilaginibacter roseus]